MNNYIKFTALIFTLILFLASCNSKVEDLKPVQLTTESVFITGKILNPTPENNTITVYENDILSGDQKSHLSLVDSSGDFQMKLNLYNSKDVLVRYVNNSFPLIVHPNDSIHIVFDADKISDKDKLAKTIQFSGSASVENSKLIAFHSEISKISIPLQQYRQYEKEKYPTDFIAIPDSLRTVRKEVANEFIQQGVSNELKEWMGNDVDFDYYNWLARYPQNHARFNELDKDTVVPSSFYDFMNIEVSREYLHNSKFIDFVSRYRFGRINAFSKKYSTSSFIGYLLEGKDNTYFGNSTAQEIEVINDITKDKFLKEILIARCLFDCLDRREIAEFEKHYSLFNKIVHEPFLREPLINKYVETRKHFERPQQNENTLLKSAKNTPAEQLISKIAQEHQGKIIYMDIWATWCSPCRKEMPNSKKLMNEINSDKVDFVYLCTDSNEDKWKALISELEIEGSHYLATPDQSRFIYELFEMSGVPQYILFDQQGNIVDKGSRLRPGESLIKTKIENLLKQQKQGITAQKS